MNAGRKQYRECSRKVGYRDFHAALDAKFRIVSNFGVYTRRLHVYRCRHCRYFHVGRQKMGRWM